MASTTLPPNIRKREGKKGVRYQAQIRLKGKRPETATFKTLKQAKDWLRKTEIEIAEDRYFRHSPAFSHTMGELFAKYESWPKFLEKKDHYSQSRQLKFWRDRIGDKSIGDVDSALISDIRDELSEGKADGRKKAAGTVNRYLACLSHVFTYAIRERKWAEQNPCRDVSRPKEPAGRVRFLSDKERKALLDATMQVDPRLHLVTVFALSTGARMGEIQKLEWKNVDLKNGTAVFVDTKNSETRSVPVAGLLLKLMKKYRKQSVANLHSDLVFPSPLDPTKVWSFRTAWNRAIEISKLQDFHFHDTRHDFASSCLSSGATLAELMHLMGHKTPAMTARYAHLAQNHAADLVAKMNARIFGS